MTHRTINDVDRDLGRVRDTLARHTRAAQNLGTNIANQKAELAALEAERKALTTRPEPAATVVTFAKQYGDPTGRRFDYAAISFTHERTLQRLWAITGKAGLAGVPWSTVSDFIDRRETELTRPKVQDLVPFTLHNNGDAFKLAFDADTITRMRANNPFKGQGYHYEVFGDR